MGKQLFPKEEATERTELIPILDRFAVYLGGTNLGKDYCTVGAQVMRYLSLRAS